MQFYVVTKVIEQRSTAATDGKKAAKGKVREGNLPPPPLSGKELDDSIFAAVCAILNGSKSKGPEGGISAASSAPSAESASQPVHSASSAIRRKPKLAKSRLSTSWLPEDVTQEDMAPTEEPTSISVGLAQPSSLPVAPTTTSLTSGTIVHDAPPLRSPSPEVPHPQADASSPGALGHIVSNGKSSISRDVSPDASTPSASAAIPAGSEIFEVSIQGQDEGSSSESDEDNDDEHEVSAAIRAVSTADLSTYTDTSRYLSEAQVENLLRGPVPRKGLLAMLPSETSSDEEQSDDEREPLASEQEEKEEQVYKRITRRLERRAPSSSDEESADDMGSGHYEEPSRVVSNPPEVEKSADVDQSVCYPT